MEPMKMSIFATIRRNRPGFPDSAYVCELGVLLLSLWLGPPLNTSPADLLKFQSPSYEEPYYRIQFPFEVKGDKVLIKGLQLNGAKAGPFLVFKGGKNIALSSPLEEGTYAFVLDYAWAGGEKYRAMLVYWPEKAKKPRTMEFAGLSPQEGGIPGGREGFYRLYQVEEEAGIERNQEVVALTLIAPKADLDPSDIVIFDGVSPVPFEIMERMESVPPETVSVTHPMTSTFKVVFPVDVKAYEKKMLLVLKGDRGPSPVTGLSVSGNGLGKTIRGSRLAIELHPQSGQIDTIESLEAGVKLYNKAGVIHWNPDVFVPGIAWDHSFDWNPPAVFEEKTGAYLYLNSRRGPLPRVKGVTLDVKYTLEAGAPYFLSETRLNFEEAQGVIAVRNDEMVLSRELFDSLFYRNNKGEIIKLPLKEKERAPFGLVHVAPEDLSWVGLVNSRDGFGFFSLRLQAALGNFEVPGEFLHKAGTYFYAPSDGNYVYWVRPLIYTWADYFTNSHFAYVPKGSFFYEKNAYVVLRLSHDLPQELDMLVERLRHPLRVF
jgi:hypothetical protein